MLEKEKNMADEINVGRLVAEIVLEAETEKAKQDVAKSAQDIQNKIKSIEDTTADIKVDVKADTKNVVADVKDATNEMTHYLKNNLNSVIDKEAYTNLLKELYSETPAEIPVAIHVEETSDNDMLDKIKLQLSEIGVEASEVDKIIKNCFGNLNVYGSYEKQINIIVAKLENQRKKLVEVRQEQEKLANTKSTSEKHIAQLEKATQSVTNEEIKLKQLENQFDKLIIAQENYVNKKVSAYQKGVNAVDNATQKEILSAEKLEKKTEKANNNLVSTQVTSGLRAIGNIVPGVSGDIADIIEQFEQLKQAINASANGGNASLGKLSIAVTAVSTVIVAAVNIYKMYAEKQDEARKKAAELAEEYKSTKTELQNLTKEYVNLKNKLDISVLSTTEEIEAKNQLYQIQKQLVESFGDEASGIDLVNGKIDDQISKIEELTESEAKMLIASNYNDYNIAKEKLSEEKTLFGIPVTRSDYNRLIADEFSKEIEGFSFEEGMLKLTVDTENAEKRLEELSELVEKLHNDGKRILSKDLYDKMRSEISTALTEVNTGDIDEWKTTVEEYDYALSVIDGTVEQSTEEQAEHFNTVFTAISQNTDAIENMVSAYEKIKAGEQLDTSALSELCNTYPELAKYIAETGDLSLQNGDKIVEAQEKILLSNIKNLASEKALLEAKTNRTDDEEKQLNTLSGALDVYQTKLRELYSNNKKPIEIGDFQTAVNDLSNAYEILSNGKELDFEQTLNLIDKYPELAQELSNGTANIDNQTEAIKNLYEAKKEEMLISLQADQTELQSLISTNNSTIQALQARMQAYSMVASVVTDCKVQIAKLEGENVDYNNNLTKTEAKISAINNLYVESGNATSQTNQKLQEQLNLINHRKAMNDLTYGEEISWLQLLYTQYATNAEERMSLDEKIYTAQQNLIKEQEQAYSDLYNTEIANLEHLKALDQLSKEQELTWLNTIYSAYVLTAEERMSLEEKIHSVQKEIRDEQEQAIKDAMQAELDLLEHEKSMDRLSAEDEIKWLERINAQYEMSTEDRRSMELKLHNAKKSHEEEIQKAQQDTLDKAIEALEKRRSSSRITYEEEIKQLREIYNTYKLTAEQQQQVLEKIRSLSSSAKSERGSQFGTLGDGVIEALKNQYQQQRDLEEERINQSIENWQTWEDETVSAIQSQIDALDELADAQESEKERQEYENKRQAIELQLAYEKDDYNRKQLQKELARLDDEENERLAEEQRKKKKEELQAQIDSVKEQSQAQQDLLQAELDAVAQNYEKLMSSYSLENEAYKMMLGKSQNEIVNFIGSYAPEYELLGQTLGEKLYIELKNKIGNIDNYFKQLQVKWQFYSNKTAYVANQAVDQFWASRKEYEQKINSMSTTPNVNLTVNFNEPVESPVQVARKMEQVTNNLVNQLKQ
ncbi:MAG: hypothetical protein UHY68_03190 [Acutalibacteraceae bacterium]|nr:hypothetical protein [Acutalibacteraceae bacterium]